MDRGNRLLVVELVEDGADGVVGAAVAPPWRPLAARVPRRVWGAVAALVTVGVAAWTGAAHLEDRALDERLAQVAGLSASLRTPLGPAWRVPGAGVLGAVGDAVLVRAADDDGVQAIAVADGGVRYTRPGRCELVATGPTAGTTTSTAVGDVRVRAADDGDLLLCVEGDAAGGTTDRTARVATARVHDPRTGALRRSIALGSGATSSTVGTDVVSIGVGPDGHVTAGRWSLLTGRPVWTYRGPSPVPRDETWGSSMDETFVRLEIGGWNLTLDTATGQRVARARWTSLRGGEARWGPVVLPDGGSATTRFAPGGTETTVLDADGAPRFSVPGFLLTPVVDDGTVPATLLVVRADTARSSRSLVALDAGTGDPRWVSTARLGQIALLGGRVVVRDPAGLTVLDAADGVARWATRSDDRGDPGWGMVTDGRRVVTLDTVAGVASMTARDLATGAPLWSTAAPVDDASLTLLPDGTVLAVGPRDVVALRP